MGKTKYWRDWDGITVSVLMEEHPGASSPRSCVMDSLYLFRIKSPDLGTLLNFRFLFPPSQTKKLSKQGWKDHLSIAHAKDLAEGKVRYLPQDVARCVSTLQ